MTADRRKTFAAAIAVLEADAQSFEQRVIESRALAGRLRVYADAPPPPAAPPAPATPASEKARQRKQRWREKKRKAANEAAAAKATDAPDPAPPKPEPPKAPAATPDETQPVGNGNARPATRRGKVQPKYPATTLNAWEVDATGTMTRTLTGEGERVVMRGEEPRT
jgi:hypothetical protein